MKLLFIPKTKMKKSTRTDKKTGVKTTQIKQAAQGKLTNDWFYAWVTRIFLKDAR